MNTPVASDVPKSPDPPGPTSRFPISLLWQFQRDPLAVAARLTSEYGDVAQLRVGRRRYVLLNHPNHIEQVLMSNNMLRSVPLAMRDLLGNGLLTSQGELHRQQRRLMNPSLPRHKIEALDIVITRCADDTIGRWRDGSCIDLSEEMLRLTLTIIAHVLMGSSPGPSTGAMLDAFAMVIKLTERNRTPYLDKLLANLPLRGNSQFKTSVEHLRGMLHAVLVERKLRDPGGTDVLSFLLEAQRCADRTDDLSDRQIEDELLALLFAGHETTSNTLTWMWYLLSQHPEEEARFHEELDAVLGGRTPVAADVPRLVYTRMVLLETLRLYPPVWVVSRRPRNDLEIGGYRVPAWSSINMFPFLMHRDPRYFPDPCRFLPLRWLPESNLKRPRFSFFPFGGGERQCLGQGFAMMEGSLLAVAIAQRWRPRLPKGHQVEAEPLITLRPKHGMKMNLDARNQTCAWQRNV